MAMDKELIDIDGKKGELLTVALDYFIGDIGKIFRFALPQLVKTDPFRRIMKTQTSVDKNFAKNTLDSDPYVTIEPKYESVETFLDYYKAQTKLGMRGLAASSALPFSVPLDLIKTHTEQAAIVMYRDLATALTASTFAAAQKDAAAGAWSVTASATPRVDVNKIKAKLMTGANIRGDYEDANMKVVLLISYNSAVEAMATDDFGTWKANAGKSINGTLEEELKAYFRVPEVVILDISDHEGSAIFTDIVDLTVVDRRGISGQLMVRDSELLLPNHSGLVVPFLEADVMFEPGQGYRVNAGGVLDTINIPIISVSAEKDAHKDLVFTCKTGYKILNHKTESLVGLTGV